MPTIQKLFSERNYNLAEELIKKYFQINNININLSNIENINFAKKNIQKLVEILQIYTLLGDVYNVPISHGEGRFIASDELIGKLAQNGQIATQYVNENGVPTMDGKDNLNGSSMAIEGIFSEDGKIFGKMGHSERYEKGLFQNIAGNKDQDIFANGVRYFTHKQVK